MTKITIKRFLAALMLGLMVALGGCVEEGIGGDDDDTEMEMEDMGEMDMDGMDGMGEMEMDDHDTEDD